MCICGVLRLFSIIPVYYSSYDMTWESYHAWIWCAVEAHVSVMCASAPALKIYFKEFIGGSNWDSRSYWPSSRRSKGLDLSLKTADFCKTEATGRSGEGTLVARESSEKLSSSSMDITEEQRDRGHTGMHDIELGGFGQEQKRDKGIHNI